MIDPARPLPSPPPPLDELLVRVGGIILGKERQIRLAVACLLARGHLLIQDRPGVGKTTLAQALARSLGAGFRRIQFTSDLLPADVLGVSVYDRHTEAFRFHPGPIFSQVILADEINRAMPKAQSALLEAMEEGRVTVEGETRPLPEPFFVIATQNPLDRAGTFPLPQSQLDRFLMCLDLGYPDARSERALLEGIPRRRLLADLTAVLDPAALSGLQVRVDRIHAAAPLLDYIQDLLAYSRTSVHFRAGLSPRAGLGLLAASRAWAFLAGREEVLPEDVQAVLHGVVGHRLVPVVGSEGEDPSNHLAAAVPIP
ncbi:MAG: AAA family ATPase [Magnetococcales bacterium]|nr:AAA family ATPase [Magnetococcales bacterium]